MSVRYCYRSVLGVSARSLHRTQIDELYEALRTAELTLAAFL